MDELYEKIRIFNFFVLFLCFMIGLYKGVRVNIEFRYAFKPERFLNLLWTVLAMYGMAEVLYKHIEGGPRVFATSVVVVTQLVITIFFYPMQSKSPEHRV